jgi:type IV secretion system protein VirB8
VAAAIAALEALAIVTMMPLKKVEPYTILVDRNTGYVETAEGLNPAAS